MLITICNLLLCFKERKSLIIKVIESKFDALKSLSTTIIYPTNKGANTLVITNKIVATSKKIDFGN